MNTIGELVREAGYVRTFTKDSLINRFGKESIDILAKQFPMELLVELGPSCDNALALREAALKAEPTQMFGLRTLDIDKLSVDSQVQLNARWIDQDIVEAYVEALNGGAEFPPVIVFNDSENLWLADGFHRVAAYLACERTEIQATIKRGTHEDALIYAAIANVTNGKPMSRAERQEAGKRLFELTNWSDREIAKKLAVNNATVSRWHENLSVANATDTKEPKVVEVTRAGTTYEMEVSNIGKVACLEEGDMDINMELPRVLQETVEGLTGESVGEAKVAKAVKVLMGTTNNIHVSDESYEWYTPAELIEAARRCMGSIDFDPASSDEAQVVVKAGVYHTKETNGLGVTWHGNVWLNPPYCMPEVELFISLAIEYYKRGLVKNAIILVNNATDAAWFHRLLDVCEVVCLTRGRIRFWKPNGEKTQTPRQGQAIFYLGSDRQQFIECFSEFGCMVTPLMEIDDNT